MSDVFYLRPIEPPITPEDVAVMAQHAGGCFKLHRVDWKQSFLAADGRRMLCWYRAPDAESARIALRDLRADMDGVWAGTVVGERPDAPPLSETNVVAEMESPEPLDEAAAGELASALAERGATLVRAFLSTRGTRLACAVRAADAQTVRSALERANVPARAVWSCTPLTPSPPGAA